MLPFNRRRRKEKKGKESPSWVNYKREERCMVDLAEVVDFAGGHERMAATTWKYLFVCSQWSSANEKRSIEHSMIYVKR